MNISDLTNLLCRSKDLICIQVKIDDKEYFLKEGFRKVDFFKFMKKINTEAQKATGTAWFKGGFAILRTSPYVYWDSHLVPEIPAELKQTK